MAEFIHVHKFTFGPHFRVHAGRRDLSDRSESVALNGPDSDEIRDWRYLLVPTRKYDLTYASDADSVERCAQGMYDFCVKVAERWFQKNRDRSACKDAEPSPATTELLGLDRIAQAKNRRPS